MRAIEAALPSAFELPFVFNKFVLGEEFCKEKLGLTDEQLNDWNFSILRDGLGFSNQQIEEASAHICGRMTLEGAPYLKDEHLAGLRLRDAVRQVRHRATSVRSRTSR